MPDNTGLTAFFRELLAYNHHYNQAIIASLSEPGTVPTEKAMELVSHIVSVHQIWNARIRSETARYTSWQLHSLEEARIIDRQNYQDSLAVLEDRDLDMAVTYSNSAGKSFTHKVRDLLFQSINHSTYHRGQLAVEFRASGKEPLLTDYIYYKMSGA